MRPTLLAPAVLLMAALMIPHRGGARLSAQRPAARRVVDRPAADPAPLAAITRLLEIDRAFSKTSSDLSMRLALDAMFADGVIAPWQRGEIVKGKAAVIRAMLQSPDSVATLSWAPIRGGVSADGLHGFTFGYLAARHPDGRLAHSKYMAYWVRESRGWRVAAWKRRPIGAAPLASAPLPPSLPRRLLKATTDGDVIARYYRSLVNAEAGFSQLAQRVGVAVSRSFDCKGLQFAVQDGAASGQTVPHLHIHVVPRRPGDFGRNDDVYEAVEQSEGGLTRLDPARQRDAQCEAARADRSA